MEKQSETKEEKKDKPESYSQRSQLQSSRLQLTPHSPSAKGQTAPQSISEKRELENPLNHRHKE